MTCLRFSSQLCRLPLWPKSKHYICGSFIKNFSSVTTSTTPNHLTSNALTCQLSDLSSVLVKRAHLQASYLMRRQFVTNNLVTKDSTAFSKRSSTLAGRGTTWLASRRSKSDTSGAGGGSASTIKDSELKAKVKATVESPAGADEQFYDRNFVTAVRAMSEFLLKPEHLVRLSITLAPNQNESFS